MPNLMDQAMFENRSGRLEDKIEQLESKFDDRLSELEEKIDALRKRIEVVLYHMGEN